MLVSYDHNEPCKGKYQCNYECDGLKTILESLNVDSVNSIFIALNQRKSVKNTKISGTEFGKAKWSLSGDTIPNIYSDHSILFSDDWIKIKHSYKQKILFDCFMQRETTGKKWYQRMFLIWSEYIEVQVYLKTSNSCFIFIMVQ